MNSQSETVGRWSLLSGSNLPFGLRAVILLPTNEVPQIPVGSAGPPSRSCICSCVLNNEGNNNERESPPIREAGGQTTYGEVTLHTFHVQLQDPSPSDAALSPLPFTADIVLEVKLKHRSRLLQLRDYVQHVYNTVYTRM